MPDLSFLLVQALNGLASASSLFIISAGLTIVFGVTRIVNFAHGSFYMLGAYLGVTLIPRLLDISSSFPMFIVGVLAAALGVGLIGVLMELVLLRRIYRVPELFQLLATFGVVLVVQDLVLKVWGPLDILGPRAPGLRHAVGILGHRFPAYELFLIAMGPLVLGLLWLLMHKTRFGVLVRAATQDREMVGALGVNQALLFTGTLFLGAALAGLGGALQTPKLAANPHMDISVIAEAFVVTVVGGMGSVPGAFLAALLIGQLQAFGILIFPKITLVLVFLLMALVLVVRPWGLMGRPDAGAARVVLPEGIVRLTRFGRPEHIALSVLGVALLLLPLDRRRLSHQGGDRGAVLCAGGLQPELPDRRRRHRQLRARRLLRSRRLCGGLAGDAIGLLHGAGAAGGTGGRRARRGAVWVLHRAADGHLSCHAHACVRADRLRGGLPVGGGDGRRQWRGGSVAVALGGGPRDLLLSGAGR